MPEMDLASGPPGRTLRPRHRFRVRTRFLARPRAAIRRPAEPARRTRSRLLRWCWWRLTTMARAIDRHHHDASHGRRLHVGHVDLDHAARELVRWLFMAGLAAALAVGVFTELLFGHIMAPIW